MSDKARIYCKMVDCIHNEDLGCSYSPEIDENGMCSNCHVPPPPEDQPKVVNPPYIPYKDNDDYGLKLIGADKMEEILGGIEALCPKCGAKSFGYTKCPMCGSDI